MSIEEVEKFVLYTSPVYMRWTTYQITKWLPSHQCKNLYRIHGTGDQIFPYKRIKNVYTIEDGDHLMIMRKPNEVNSIIKDIILK
jgi:hypothetical protein